MLKNSRAGSSSPYTSYLALLAQLVLALVVLIDLQRHPTIARVNAAVLSATVVISVLLSVKRVIWPKWVAAHPRRYILLYYALLAGGLVFVAPVGSFYTFLWLSLLYESTTLFGSRAIVVSLFTLEIALEAQALLAGGGSVTTDVFWTQFSQFGLFVVAGVFFLCLGAARVVTKKIIAQAPDGPNLEHERLITLINNMTNGVIATNETGHIKLYNAAALSLLDTNQNIQDQPVNHILGLIDKNNRHVDILELAEKKRIAFTNSNFRLRYPDDETINLYLSVAPIRLGFGREGERGYIITFRDITREKSLEAERDEFISVISHELRTPVAITEANISNALFINDKKYDKSAVKSSLDTAHQQVMYLAGLVNDLSTLSRAERGMLKVDPEPIKPADLVQEIYNEYRIEAEHKGLKLEIELAEDVPKAVTSSKLYVKEILQNFVTNALKYTPKGNVTIRVAAADNGVLFSVHDSGIGISKSDQKRVFDKFFRSEDYRTRATNGTGLGLYITEKLAKLIHAEISLESELDKGSTFSVSIPNMSSPASHRNT